MAVDASVRPSLRKCACRQEEGETRDYAYCGHDAGGTPTSNPLNSRDDRNHQCDYPQSSDQSLRGIQNPPPLLGRFLGSHAKSTFSLSRLGCSGPGGWRWDVGLIGQPRPQMRRCLPLAVECEGAGLGRKGRARLGQVDPGMLAKPDALTETESHIRILRPTGFWGCRSLESTWPSNRLFSTVHRQMSHT